MARCITALCLAALIALFITGAARGQTTNTVEQWGTYEVRLHGPVAGNPFVDVKLTATFTSGDEAAIEVPGFYDGDGSYCLRFMPPRQGKWTYRTHGSAG